MAALAGIDDYTARYGEPADAARTEVLLQDASDLVLAAFEDRMGAYAVGACPAFDRAAPAVWELDGPIITGPRMSKISSIGKTPFVEWKADSTAIIAYILPECERTKQIFFQRCGASRRGTDMPCHPGAGVV